MNKSEEMIAMYKTLGIQYQELSLETRLAILHPETYNGNLLYASLSLHILIKQIKDKLRRYLLLWKGRGS